jgi:hypothetical protein
VIADLNLIGVFEHMAPHLSAIDTDAIDALQILDDRNCLDGCHLAVMTADEARLEAKVIVQSPADAGPAGAQRPG